MRKKTYLAPSLRHIQYAYLAPSLRHIQYAVDGHFLTSALVGGVTPGQDPENGGSWNFGEDD